MQISLIVAVAENGVIGVNNQLPWQLSEDLKRFKQLTMGHYILMGRSTFDAIGKVLPGRVNMVVSSNDVATKEVVKIDSLWEGIDQAEKGGETELFIIGGEHVFNQAIGYATKMYVTRIHKAFKGDRYFKFDANEWTQIASETFKTTEFDYSFEVYERALTKQPLACGFSTC